MPNWFTEGGPMMYVILAASVVGTGCIFYCLLMLRRQAVLPQTLLDLAETMTGAEADDKGVESCRRDGGPFAEILLTVIATREAGREEAETLVESAGRRAAHDLSRGLLALEVVAAIAPLLGLLGTVLGMHTTFTEIEKVGVQGIKSISGGIKQALDTTIFGLIVGIPAFVAFTYFTRRIDDLVLEMERYAVIFMGRLRSH